MREEEQYNSWLNLGGWVEYLTRLRELKLSLNDELATWDEQAEGSMSADDEVGSEQKLDD